MNNFAGIIGAVFVAVIAAAQPISYMASAETTSITVNKTERECGSSNTECYYMVYAKEEVFQNKDSWLFLKFDSSNVQNSLENGKTYKVRVAGWRIPFLSMYRNIIEVTK